MSDSSTPTTGSDTTDKPVEAFQFKLSDLFTDMPTPGDLKVQAEDIAAATHKSTDAFRIEFEDGSACGVEIELVHTGGVSKTDYIARALEIISDRLNKL